MVHRTTLQFSSILDLWLFKGEINTFYHEVNAIERTLTHCYSPEELKLAISKYGASLYEPATKNAEAE